MIKENYEGGYWIMLDNITDEEIDRLEGLLKVYGVQIEELIEGFIGDLIDGDTTSGQDERRLARNYVTRRYS